MKHRVDNHHQTLNAFFWVIIVPVLVLLALDSVGNSGFVVKLIGIESHQLVIPTLLLTLIFRLTIGTFLSSLLQKLVGIACVTGLVAGSMLTFYDALTEPNVAYALTRIHQDRLWLLVVFLGLVLLINGSSQWWSRHRRSVLFITPIVCFYIAYITSLFPFDIFLHLVKEDQLIEYGQFWVLALGSLYALWRSQKFRNAGHWAWSMFFGICSFAFFFVAGDEISWGQRIMGFEVNETIKELNRQDEMTIHNLHAVEWLVVWGYVASSLFGAIGYWVLAIFRPLRKFVRYVPNKLLIGYFLFPLTFFVAQVAVEGGIWHSWAEVAELYLYAGLVIWIVLLGSPHISQSHNSR
jgi:hypothetical protein